MRERERARRKTHLNHVLMPQLPQEPHFPDRTHVESILELPNLNLRAVEARLSPTSSRRSEKRERTHLLDGDLPPSVNLLAEVDDGVSSLSVYFA
jgi:hypothetical protein